MASKKGIAITAIILAAITGASFLSWLVPQDVETTFVVTDYEEYLDGVKSIHEVLEQSTELEYKSLQDGLVSPEEYARSAEITSDQVTAKVGEFVTSKPPEEWQASYISYMDALRSFNAYVTETKVLAAMMGEGTAGEAEMAEVAGRIDALRSEVAEHVAASDRSRPGT